VFFAEHYIVAGQEAFAAILQPASKRIWTSTGKTYSKQSSLDCMVGTITPSLIITTMYKRRDTESLLQKCLVSAVFIAIHVVPMIWVWCPSGNIPHNYPATERAATRNSCDIERILVSHVAPVLTVSTGWSAACVPRVRPISAFGSRVRLKREHLSVLAGSLPAPTN